MIGEGDDFILIILFSLLSYVFLFIIIVRYKFKLQYPLKY